jgi:dihydroxy-acid dehydratase
MGHQGMKSSLVSREVIADSVELTMRGHCYDALVGFAGCDKSLPGMMMAMLRLNVPSVFIYGGSILPGRFRGKDVTVQDVFEAVGKHAAGKMSDEDLHELESVACPGPAPAAASSPPTPWPASPRPSAWRCPARPARRRPTNRATPIAEASGRRSWRCWSASARATSCTREALENAARVVAATGGSTNAGAAPAGHRPRGGIDFDLFDVAEIFKLARPTSPTSSPAGSTSPRTCTRPAACRWR